MTRVRANHQIITDDNDIIPEKTEGTVAHGNPHRRGMCRVNFDNGVETPVYRSEFTIIRKKK